MYIQTVMIQGMHNVINKSYTFDKTNYIVGRNGAGKSTILQAIQLALLGYIPETGKAKGSVFQHMNGKNMQVSLDLIDGDTHVKVTRMFMSIGSKNSSEVIVEPEGFSLESIISSIELPIFNFNELLGMTANAQKDWFIKFLPECSSTQDIGNKLSEAIRDLKNDTTDDFIHQLKDDWASILQANADSGIVSSLNQFNSRLKTVRQLKQSEQTRVIGTIDSLIRYDDECADAGMLDVIQAERTKLRMQRDSVVDYLNKREQFNRIQSEINQFAPNEMLPIESDAEYVEANNEKLAIEKQMADTNQRILVLRGRRDQYRDQMAPLEALLKSTDGTCPFTKSLCEKVTSIVSDARTSYGLIQEDYLGVSNQISELEKSLNTLRARHTELANIQVRILSRHEAYKRLADMQIVEPVQPEGVSNVAEIDSILRDIETRYNHIQANIQYAKLADKLTSDKFRIDLELEIIKRLIAATGPNGIQSTLAVQPFAELADSMYSYTSDIFGSDRKPSFIISEKANSFSFGLINTKTSEYVPFALLSSGEKCVMSIAVMMAIIHRAESPLKILMVDDIFDHLDKDNYTNLMKMVVAHPEIQCIFAGVIDETNDSIVNKIKVD